MTCGEEKIMRWIILFGIASAVSIVLAVVALWAFGWADALGINGHGLVALTIGIVFTAGLGIGLMALIFHSSRSGHDDVSIRFGEKGDA